MKILNNLKEVQNIISNNTMVLTYFTSSDCNLCKDLFPKVKRMLEEFPNVVAIRSEVDEELGLVGTYNVFTIPTIILFIEGKETIRRSRQIGIKEFSDAMNRYYSMIYE
ncbi:MAG: thioredoxin family protein [Clostridiales bacterium]|nr:thioredoxin family protein [Clostridiales bacterium]